MYALEQNENKNNEENSNFAKIKRLENELNNCLSKTALLNKSIQNSTLPKEKIGDILNDSNSIKFDKQEVHVEQVVRIKDKDPAQKGVNNDGSTGSNENLGGNQRLIDSDKNEYIMSKPDDLTNNQIDLQLLLDFCEIIVAASIGGFVVSLLGQPILIGFLLGGSIIGPGGLGVIQQFIQIETLAHFGSTFLLFALGLEVSFEKLEQVRHVAIYGGLKQILVFVVATVSILSLCFRVVLFKTGIFLGFVFSMSSTTVALKSLMERNELDTIYGQIMIAILVIQDVTVGIVLALIPIFIDPLSIFGFQLFYLIGKLLFLIFIIFVLMRIVPWFLLVLEDSSKQDLFLLGILAMCITMTQVTEYLVSSAELGAFISGFIISSTADRHKLGKRAIIQFESLRDMFGALFFTSIGMLIDLEYILNNQKTLFTFILAIIIIKSVGSAIIIKSYGYDLPTSVKSAVGLAQVGEFAFVLASRGHSAKLVSKDVYRLILSTTALGLLFAPFVFKFSCFASRQCFVQNKTPILPINNRNNFHIDDSNIVSLQNQNNLF